MSAQPAFDESLDAGLEYDENPRLRAGLAARWVNWPEYFERVLPHDRPLQPRDLLRLDHWHIWRYRLLDGCLLCVPRAPEYALSWHELQERPDRSHWMFELMEGMLVVSPNSPTERHQSCAGSLYMLLRAACPPELKTLMAPFEYLSGAPFGIQPDVLVARRPIGALRLEHAPLLVVEVLSESTSNRDRGLKQEAYRRAGVDHFWLLEPEQPSIQALHLVCDVYEEVGSAAAGEIFSVEVPFPIRFDPADLLDEG